MSTQILRAILGSCFAIALGLSEASARAAATITARQIGPHVVLTGFGSLDLHALTFLQRAPRWFNYFSTRPDDSEFQVGPAPSSSADLYDCGGLDACISGPANFGKPGESYFFPDFGFGDAFGYWDFDGYRGITVPVAYVSGSELAGSSIYLDRTLAQMGIKLGTTVYSWGSGATADSIRFTTEAPGPLPLVGAASALAWTRLLRHRLRAAARWPR